MSQVELERYRTRLAGQQADAKAYLIARLESEARGGNLDVAGIREKTIEVMRDCLGVYGDRAQALSAELFDEICEAEGVDATSKIFDELIDGDMMEEKVRYYARAIAGEEPDWDGYEGSNADLVSYYVHRSALENMSRNCDLNEMRFARVGTGRETCGYCFMLSSRGFVYRSEDTAAASSHVHCDCVIVPGVKGVTKIEGYEPERMRERWKACYQTIGGRDQLKEDWDALDAKGRAAYKGRSEAEKYLDFVRKRTQRECETRDNEWLYRGTDPTPKEEEGARPSQRERATMERLATQGLKLMFRKTRENVDGGLRTSDTFMIVGTDSRERMVPLEFKQPMGAGKNNIYNQFNEASGQAKRLVIDTTRSPFTYDEVCRKARAALARRDDFTDVYVLGKDELRHYEK